MAYIARITYAKGHPKADGDFFDMCWNVVWLVTDEWQTCLICNRRFRNTHKKYRHKNILADNLPNIEDWIK